MSFDTLLVYANHRTKEEAFKSYNSCCSPRRTRPRTAESPKLVNKLRDLQPDQYEGISQTNCPAERDHFYFGMLPDKETGRAGINLLSTPKQGEIRIYDGVNKNTETIPLLSSTLHVTDTNTNNLLFAYRGITGNVDGNEIFVRTHPYIKRTRRIPLAPALPTLVTNGPLEPVFSPPLT